MGCLVIGGEERLHFIPDKAKGNGKRYCKILLTKLVEDCKSLLPSGFIFQQDGAPAHTAKLAQNWIATNCSEFIGKDEWPPNSPDTLILLITTSGELCLNATRNFNPSQTSSTS